MGIVKPKHKRTVTAAMSEAQLKKITDEIAKLEIELQACNGIKKQSEACKDLISYCDGKPDPFQQTPGEPNQWVSGGGKGGGCLLIQIRLPAQRHIRHGGHDRTYARPA